MRSGGDQPWSVALFSRYCSCKLWLSLAYLVDIDASRTLDDVVEWFSGVRH